MPYRKLSISVSDELLQKVDKARAVLGETRSGLIQRLMICWMQDAGLRQMESAVRVTEQTKKRKPKVKT